MNQSESYAKYAKQIASLHDLLSNISRDMGYEFRLTPSDIPHYSCRNPHLFGRFPWYYELVSRMRAVYVHSPQHFFCGISLPWEDGKNGCFSESLVLVRPEVNGSLDKLVEFSQVLSEQSKCSLVVKHVYNDTAQQLLTHGFRYYKKEFEAWSENAREDDQTYDEVVIRIEETLANPPALQRSRAKADLWMSEYFVDLKNHRDMEDSEVRLRCKHDVLSVFYKWLHQFEDRRQPWSVTKEFLDWHLYAFGNLVADKELTLLFLRNSEDEPVGVFSLAKTNALQADVVFSFIAEEDGDFQRLAYRKIFEEVSRMGYRYMNLGGSEVESLFKFKCSLGVSTLIKARHLFFDLPI